MSRLQQSDWSVIARLTNYHVGNDANMRALGEVFFSAWKNALQTHHTTKNSLGRRDKSRLPALPEDIALQGFSPLGSLFETVRLPASETTCTTTVPGGDLRTHRASRLYGFALLASSLPNTVIPIEAVSASTRQADALQAGGRVADSSESDTVSDDGNHGNGSRTGSVNLSRRSSASCKSLQQAKVSYGAFLLENGGGNGTGSTTNNGNSTGGGGNAYPEMTHSHSASNISNTTASTESGAIKVFKASREINGYRKVWHQGAGGGEWRREGDYEFLRAKESKRETLMKAMGKQRLLAVVDSLEQKVGHAESNSRIEGEPQSGQPSQGNIGMDTGTGVGSTGRGRGGNNGNGGVLMSGSGVNDGVSGLEYQYTLYVVPDLHVVLYSRNHLNAVIGQKRFIVVIASAVVAALDMLKTSDRQGDYRNNRGGRFGIGMDDQGGGGGGSGNGPNYATSVQPSHKEIMAASRWIENMQQTNGQHFQVQPQANARLSSNAMGNMGGNSGGSNNVGGYNADTQDTVEERCWRGVVACARDLLKSRADKVEHTQASGSESMYAILLLNRGLSYDPTTALGVHVSRSDAFVTSVAPEINLNDVRKPRHRRK
ncbi:hypothetical protein SARC_02518 [Sphaeroforma arctica JP610]|uniref:Uncharacterized protein n=1 Tax=Sphaeroforma arctica JP610 TaxID=667725 RepID=A0A0L0G8G8_9EUKA|nr:hypothetical protein SARC_02518 [Sphaeroforma arctica JP610]KNC85295.1 hypothetical protein SARC_02518 [Sphaeroforma arctica JP610]|eukprot:XP_014159197.1 hypothetical protein SARC_02518 [Sphaeroforma arctica JP610]